MERLGELGTVDGHDAGSGEANIFIITSDPRAAFDRIKTLLERSDLREPRVAYRALGTDEFTIIYPIELSHFAIA